MDGSNMGAVLDAIDAERAALLELLAGLSADQWQLPTECPSYSVAGVATHVLGDDLSLLSRQRDGAESGLIAVAMDMPGADFRTLLDTFNDRWTTAAGFLSPRMLTDLLAITTQWTREHFRSLDPDEPGEPVGLFGFDGPTSPTWKAIAREFIERWIHHSQMRRAVHAEPLPAEPCLHVGIDIVAAVVGLPAHRPGAPPRRRPTDSWRLGPLDLGSAPDATAILTRAHDDAELRSLLTGPVDAVDKLSAYAAR